MDIPSLPLVAVERHILIVNTLFPYERAQCLHWLLLCAWVGAGLLKPGLFAALVKHLKADKHGKGRDRL